MLYATCFVNYNNPDIGTAARAVLAQNGVETEVVYPGCCGMPQLEQGDLDARRRSGAARSSAALLPWIDKGYDIIALTPSCALMLKFEWPLILPDDADVEAAVAGDLRHREYVVDIAKKEGLAPGLKPLRGRRHACISPAMPAPRTWAPKAAEMLRLIPETRGRR